MPLAVSEVPPSGNMDEAVAALLAASETPAKQRKSKVSTAVDEFCRQAFRNGVSRNHLDSLVDILTRRTELDQASTNAVIKNLYPADKVSSATVVSVVGALGPGKGKPSTSTQVALTKWLTFIYEVLEDQAILSRLYGLLFNLLDTFALRAPLCHLLSLVTRRKHVRPFRIYQLLELSRTAGNEPALLGLLRIYKDYCPDIIIGSATYERAALPPLPNPEWRARLLHIQNENSRNLEDTALQRNGFRIVRHGAKRSKISVLPEVHTHRADGSMATLEEISSVDSFAESLHKIELPDQMMSSLRDPLLQKYLILNPSEIASKRTEFLLLAYLEEELEAVRQNASPSAQLTDVLMGALAYAKSTKTLPPAIEVFLARYLHYWDGRSDVETILELLSYIPSGSFKDFKDTYLNALEGALLANHPNAHPKLLGFYTQLVRHRSSLSSLSPSAAATFRQLIADLADHVSRVTLATLASSSPHPATTSAILSFYEALSTLTHPTTSSDDESPTLPIILPPPHAVYHLLLSPSLSTLSRLTALLATLKSSFEATLPSRHPRDTTNQFNGHLMDAANLLWRSRGLLTADANAVGCLFPDAAKPALQAYLQEIDHEYSLPAIFGLSHNHLLAALSAAALRELEDRAEAGGREVGVRHAGPATQRSLVVLGNEGGLEVSWKGYRVEVLEWLEGRGVGGVKKLMFASMKNLAGA